VRVLDCEKRSKTTFTRPRENNWQIMQ
jgi:hypothetical protein